MTVAVCGDGWHMQCSVDGRLLQRVVLDILSRHHAACMHIIYHFAIRDAAYVDKCFEHLLLAT